MPSKKTLQFCREKLEATKEEILHQLKNPIPISAPESGDTVDHVSNFNLMHNSLDQRERLVQRLREIQEAFERIEDGSYGICEETGEPIEERRLMAVPWTRLSLLGAEIVEEEEKSHAAHGPSNSSALVS